MDNSSFEVVSVVSITNSAQLMQSFNHQQQQQQQQLHPQQQQQQQLMPSRSSRLLNVFSSQHNSSTLSKDPANIVITSPSSTAGMTLISTTTPTSSAIPISAHNQYNNAFAPSFASTIKSSNFVFPQSVAAISAVTPSSSARPCGDNDVYESLHFSDDHFRDKLHPISLPLPLNPTSTNSTTDNKSNQNQQQQYPKVNQVIQQQDIILYSRTTPQQQTAPTFHPTTAFLKYKPQQEQLQPNEIVYLTNAMIDDQLKKTTTSHHQPKQQHQQLLLPPIEPSKNINNNNIYEDPLMKDEITQFRGTEQVGLSPRLSVVENAAINHEHTTLTTNKQLFSQLNPQQQSNQQHHLSPNPIDLFNSMNHRGTPVATAFLLDGQTKNGNNCSVCVGSSWDDCVNLNNNNNNTLLHQNNQIPTRTSLVEILRPEDLLLSEKQLLRFQEIQSQISANSCLNNNANFSNINKQTNIPQNQQSPKSPISSTLTSPSHRQQNKSTKQPISFTNIISSSSSNKPKPSPSPLIDTSMHSMRTPTSTKSRSLFSQLIHNQPSKFEIPTRTTNKTSTTNCTPLKRQLSSKKQAQGQSTPLSSTNLLTKPTTTVVSPSLNRSKSALSIHQHGSTENHPIIQQQQQQSNNKDSISPKSQVTATATALTTPVAPPTLRRNFSEFLNHQDTFLKQKEEKQKKIKDQAEQAISDAMKKKPDISKNSKLIAASSTRKIDNNEEPQQQSQQNQLQFFDSVHNRLYQQHKKSNSIYSPISQDSNKENTFHPSLHHERSRSQKRLEKIEDSLYNDALIRRAKNQDLTSNHSRKHSNTIITSPQNSLQSPSSSSSMKLISAKSEQICVMKFISEITLIFNSLTISQIVMNSNSSNCIITKLDLSQLFEVLLKGGFIKQTNNAHSSTDNQISSHYSLLSTTTTTGVSEIERKLVILIWTLLGGDKFGYVLSANLTYFLAIVLNLQLNTNVHLSRFFDQSQTQQNYSHVRSPSSNSSYSNQSRQPDNLLNDGLFKINLGHFRDSDGLWVISEEEKAVVRSAFQMLYRNRLTSEELKLQKDQSNTESNNPCTFKPAILAISKQIALNKNIQANTQIKPATSSVYSTSAAAAAAATPTTPFIASTPCEETTQQVKKSRAGSSSTYERPKIESELAECSFKPEISEKSKRIAKESEKEEFQVTGLQKFEQLYRDGKKRDDKLKEAQSEKQKKLEENNASTTQIMCASSSPNSSGFIPHFASSYSQQSSSQLTTSSKLLPNRMQQIPLVKNTDKAVERMRNARKYKQTVDEMKQKGYNNIHQKSISLILDNSLLASQSTTSIHSTTPTNHNNNRSLKSQQQQQQINFPSSFTSIAPPCLSETPPNQTPNKNKPIDPLSIQRESFAPTQQEQSITRAIGGLNPLLHSFSPQFNGNGRFLEEVNAKINQQAHIEPPKVNERLENQSDINQKFRDEYYFSDQILQQPLLFVDVNLGNHRTERIIINQDDCPKQLAFNFALLHGLDDSVAEKLSLLLENQLANLLSRIEEEDTSSRCGELSSYD